VRDVQASAFGAEGGGMSCRIDKICFFIYEKSSVHATGSSVLKL
jgi:hypothetical protein